MTATTLTFTSDGTPRSMGNLVISLAAVDDTLVEGDESYTVALATPSSTTGAPIALGTGFRHHHHQRQ